MKFCSTELLQNIWSNNIFLLFTPLSTWDGPLFSPSYPAGLREPWARVNFWVSVGKTKQHAFSTKQWFGPTSFHARASSHPLNYGRVHWLCVWIEIPFCVMLGTLIQLSLDTHLETRENRDNMGVFGFLFRFCKPKTHAHMLGLKSVLSLSLRRLARVSQCATAAD